MNVSEPFATYRMQYYAVNLDPARDSPLQDKLVRQALFRAIDRGAILHDIRQGNGDVAVGTQPLLSCAYDPERYDEKYEYDPELAESMLADEGWLDLDGDSVLENDGRALEFSVLINFESGDIADIANLLKEQWEAVGADVTIETELVWPEFMAKRDDGEFDILIEFRRFDPSGNQSQIFQSENAENYTSYANPAYDEKDWEQLRQLDPAARREALLALSAMVWDDLPIGPMYFYRNQVVSNANVHNVFPNDYSGTAYWSLPYMWIAEETSG